LLAIAEAVVEDFGLRLPIQLSVGMMGLQNSDENIIACRKEFRMKSGR